MRIAPDRLFVMENHDQAYRIWRDPGATSRTLVHIDAHHDMWWAAEGDSIGIANFICPAVKEGLVKEIFWVVPDASWADDESRQPILRHLNRIVNTYPKPRAPVKFHGDHISTTVLGCGVRVSTLEALPVFTEPVLLDIDIDFAVIPRVSFSTMDRHAVVPWIWPVDLASRLRQRVSQADLLTIVYSVNGGYTPLKWKYLADELNLRLAGIDAGDSRLCAMDLLRESATAAHSDDAEQKCRQAMALLPDSAAPVYHLASIRRDGGRIDEARALFTQAAALDSTYSGLRVSLGHQHHWDGAFAEAEKAHRETLTLDPVDAGALFGLGLLEKRRRRWPEAETLFRRAVELKPEFIDARRGLADALARQGRVKEAIPAYLETLRCALAGGQTLEASSVTCAEMSGSFTDRWHFQTYARLAELYAQDGAIDAALNMYRMSIAAKNDGPLIRWRLAGLHLRKRQWTKAASELCGAALRIPEALARNRGKLARATRRVFAGFA